LAILSPLPAFVAGTSTGPLVIQVQNSVGGQATFATAVTLDLSSSTTGDYSFSLSPSGIPATSSCVLPAGTSSISVYYTGYKAETENLNVTVLAAIATSSVSQAIAVSPAAYFKLQVLMPNQVSDPGKPNSDPLGRIGLPNSVESGNSVMTTVNAVDKYFNLVNTVANGLTFTVTDGTVQTAGTLAAGTDSHSDIFITASSQTLTAKDGSAGFTGTSDPIQILPGLNSTQLNVVHGSPNLSTVILGQTGVAVLTFNLTVQTGTHTILIDSLALNAQDQSGAGVALGSAFQYLILEGPTGVLPQPVTLNTANSTLTTATFSSPISVVTGPSLPLTLLADIQPAATAKTVLLSLGQNGIAANDVTSGTTVVSTSFGDSTGFPMNSSLMLFETSDVASTYGNYPNPFHPETGSTTIEFNLSNPTAYSLVIYDILGKRVKTFQSNGPQTGLQQLLWDGKNDAGVMVLSGIYFAQLNAGGTYFLKIAVAK
jgi:hypothetical protein